MGRCEGLPRTSRKRHLNRVNVRGDVRAIDDRDDGNTELSLDFLDRGQTVPHTFLPIERDDHAGRPCPGRGYDRDALPNGRPGRDHIIHDQNRTLQEKASVRGGVKATSLNLQLRSDLQGGPDDPPSLAVILWLFSVEHI